MLASWHLHTALTVTYMSTRHFDSFIFVLAAIPLSSPTPDFYDLTLIRLVSQYFTIALQPSFQFCAITFLLTRAAGYANTHSAIWMKTKLTTCVNVSLRQTPTNAEQVNTAWCLNIPPGEVLTFPVSIQSSLTILSDVVVSKSFVQKTMGSGFRIALASWFRPLNKDMAFKFLCVVTRELITIHFTNSFSLTGKLS